jgi:hypothetical protein
MAIRVVRLGSARGRGEGLRIGTVRRPPRGVPKSEFASQNWYDIWFPILAPSVETLKLGQTATTPAHWATFLKKYRAGNVGPGSPPCPRAPCRVFPSQQFLDRMLLQERIPLPSLGIANVTGRAGSRD